MTVTTAKWTIDEYHRMIAAGILDERRMELLKGEIVEIFAEGEPHAYFSSEAGEYLIQLLGDRATVRPSKPITLHNNSEPEPDIAIVKRLGREYLEHHPYPENIFWLSEYSDDLQRILTWLAHSAFMFNQPNTCSTVSSKSIPSKTANLSAL